MKPVTRQDPPRELGDAPWRRLRVLCLFKRRYMRKDVIADRYARLYELPLQLARRGHDVLGICLNYRGRGGPYEDEHTVEDGRLRWRAVDLGRAVLPGLLRYRREVLAAIAGLRPHLLLGASDCLQVALARHFAEQARCPYALDLYDNYESFGLARIPGLRRAYRRALRDATAISFVSDPLRTMVEQRYRPRGTLVTLESTIDPGVFTACPVDASRRRLRLPTASKLIGTAGALDDSRDTATLFAAYARLRAERDDVALVLAGSRRGMPPLPEAAGVHHLGELSHAEMPYFFSALDVAVIGMRDSAFGRYAFPQKAYEILACGTPVVAARVGALASLLEAHPHSLYRPGDSDSLLVCLRRQLAHRRPLPLTPPSWAQQAARLERLLLDVLPAG